MERTVREIVCNRKEIYSVSDRATVAEAARYLRDREIRATSVADSSGNVVGVLSQSDISDKVVAEDCKPSELTALEISSTKLVKVTPETLCRDAAAIMNEHGMYHLLVQEQDGTFLGMISLRDCTMVKAEEERERAEALKEYAFPRY